MSFLFKKTQSKRIYKTYETISNREKNVKIKSTIKQCFEKFIEDRTLRNVREATIKSYKDGHRNFFKYIEEKELTYISEVSSETITDYLKYLNSKNISKTTIKSYITNLKAFMNFCFKKKYITEKIEFDPIKCDDFQRKAFSDFEVKILLANPTNEDLNKGGFVWHRSYVFMYYLLATGNRLSSALNIKVCDLDFKKSEVYLEHNKDRNYHTSPLDKKLIDVLKFYIETWELKNEHYLFSNCYGEKISDSQIQEQTKVFCNGRGVNKSDVHSARHFYAKKKIENGVDTIVLMKLLHHKDIKQTQKYVDMYRVDIKQKALEHDVFGNKYVTKKVMFRKAKFKVS